MKFKKKKIASLFSSKNYYDFLYDNDEELIEMVSNIIKLLNEKVIYFSYYISNNPLEESFKVLKQFKINNKIIYELKDYNILNLLINIGTINKIRHLNIYFLKNQLTENIMNYNKFDFDYEIYFENYLEETVFGGKKEICNDDLIYSIINKK